MSLFPTKRWLDDYRRSLNESKALDDVATGWGIGFNGDILLVIEDIPLEETTLNELPDVLIDQVSDKVCEDISDVTLAEAPSVLDGTLREQLPERHQYLLHQVEEYIVDGTIYAYIGLDEGTCTGVEILKDPTEREVGSVIRGTCETWQQIIDGRPAASAVLSGDLNIDGNRLLMPQYTAVLQLLGDIAADVETTHIFERSPSSLQNFVLDEAVRQPLAVQQMVHRQATMATKLFSIF